MDADDLRLFAASLRQALERDPEVETALAEIGWYDAVADEPGVASAVFALQGELNLTSSAIDDVVITGLGLRPRPDLAAVLPTLGTASPPASAGSGRSAICGFATGRILTAEEAVIAVPCDGGVRAGRVATEALQRRTVQGLDPAGRWVEVRGDVELALPESVDWDGGVAAGRRAVAQELLSAARVMLRLAREHALVREQFGRPISAFQAVRHRLADCLIAVESADAAVTVAWADPSPFAATMAKVIAGRSAATVARHAQQILAGIGFTGEHPFHGYLKRTMLLDQLFGTSASITAATGSEVLRTGRVPAMLPL